MRRSERGSRTSWLVVAASIATVCMTVTSSPASRAAIAQPPADPQEILWGARVGTQNGQSDLGALSDMETAVGRQFDVVRIFTSWERPWPDSYANRLAANDQIPLLSVKPKRDNGAVIRWANIAAAAPNSSLYNDIVDWADNVKAFPGPVYFTFHHEAEASANLPYGTDAEFIQAWRKVVEVFRAEGVTNATYLWIATDFSFATKPTERRYAAKWYPGDAWVDAIGADAYNWVDCRQRNEGWRSLQQIIEPLRQFGLAHPTKELWLPEFATVEDPNDLDRKADWLRDATALFQQPGWEQFSGVAYFHYLVSSFPNCEWWINSSIESVDAFAAMGADPFFGGDVPPPADPTALFVVGDPALLTTADATASVRLSANNLDVTVIDDGLVTATQAEGYDVVLISSSVSSGFGARLRDITTPVVIWKPWVYDDMKMTGTVANTDYRNVVADGVTITAPAHPLAAGKTGFVNFFTAQAFGAGVPSAGADVVATAGVPALFVYESGAAMFGGFVAPGCRIAFPSGTSGMRVMSAAAWDLFIAAASYAADGCEAGQ
jgi:Glycosyl hydrolase family 26